MVGREVTKPYKKKIQSVAMKSADAGLAVGASGASAAVERHPVQVIGNRAAALSRRWKKPPCTVLPVPGV